jgi:N utilization substance protein A
MENSRELIMLVEAVAKEKGLPEEDVLAYLSEGIEVALRKNFPEGAILHVEIDGKTGEIQSWRLYELVDQIENLEAQMLKNEVEDEEVLDGYAWERFESKLSRQQYSIIKQVALQRIKNQAREQSILHLLDKNINIYSGIIKVARKDSIIVDCAGIDITIWRRNLLPRENAKVGDRIRFTLEEEKGNYFGTRTSEKFLTELFKEEISQIEDGDIEIVSCARIPGFRSKIIVKSKNTKFDAARMCIGAKGVHVKNIQNEIPGEFIDIITYNEDPAQMLISSLAPVTVSHIMIDEDTNTIEVAVDNNNIAQAIGRNGKNIEMVGKLIGWNIKIFSDEQWDKNKNNENVGLIHYFKFALDCDNELAQYIVDCGHTSIEEFIYLSSEEIQMDDLDEDTINALKQNATETMENPEKIKQANAYKDLFSLDFEEDEVNKLIENDVFSIHDISELSTYDLQDILPNIDMTKAKDIIVKSRQLQEE